MKKGKASFIQFVIILAIVAFSFFISYFLYQDDRENIYENKEEIVKKAASGSTRYIIDTYLLYFNSGTLKFTEIMENVVKQNKDFTSFQILKVDQRILYDSRYTDDYQNDTSGRKSDIEKTMLESSEIYFKNSEGRIEYVLVPYIDDWNSHQYSVLYYVDYSDVEKQLENFKLMLIIVAISIDLVFAVVLFLFLFSERYQLEREKAKKLEEINQTKDEFMNLISHNLRTPLTIIKGYLSMSENPKTVSSGNIEGMREGVDRLSYLVEDIILTTEIMSGEKQFKKEKLDLNDLFKEIHNECKSIIDQKEVILRLKVQGNSKFNGDKDMIKIAIGNIVKNALKFSNADGVVTLQVENFSDFKIIVTDNGAGIKPEKLKSLMTLFHRGTDTLNYDFEGAGLGLYLTNLIAKHYNGSLTIVSEGLNKGTKVEIILKEKNEP